MREIKFRAFHKPTNRIFDVYGLGKDWCTEDTINGVDPGVNCFDGDEFKNDIVIMQFTGLTDKNGKEIYEGDADRYNRQIRFIDGSFKVCNGVGMAFVGSFTMQLEGFGFEVSGNIHENKDQ